MSQVNKVPHKDAKKHLVAETVTMNVMSHDFHFPRP